MPDPLTPKQPEKLNLARIEALAIVWGKVGEEFGVPALAAKLREAGWLVANLKTYERAIIVIHALHAPDELHREARKFAAEYEERARSFHNSISWEDEGDASETKAG